MSLRTGNPALNANTFINLPETAGSAGTMTIDGTVNKTGFLLLLVALSAGFCWKLYFTGTGAETAGNPAAVMPFMIGGALGGFIVALITAFKKEWAHVTAPIYAILEGLFVGGLSAILEARYQGIVIQAVALTFGTLLALLLAYKSRLIRATENFKLGVIAATGAVCLFYFATIILSLFGINTQIIRSSGPLGIGISLVIVIIAALNLVLDFDFIENGASEGAPKYMEWYGAFGLMVTLIWLYIEILRLLSLLRSRD